MRGIFASFIVLVSLLAGQLTSAQPAPDDCCAESTVVPGDLVVIFDRTTSEERIEEIIAETGVLFRWFGANGLVRMCAPTGQEHAKAALFETYPEVRSTRVWGPGCRGDEPRCDGCCPSGYVCPDLAPCDPHFEIPDGDDDGFPDRCDTCTDSDGDLFGNPDAHDNCVNDNCPYAFNPDQSDFDADGLGDVCDRQLTICHNPPSWLDRPRTIGVNGGAFAVHQAHGDTLGPCESGDRCNVPFTRVLGEGTSRISERGFEIIDNEDSWCEFWTQLYDPSHFSPRPCNTTLIDFNTEIAIVTATGSYRNSCGAIVTCVRKPAGVGTITVEATHFFEVPGCICLSGSTPLEVVKIPRFGTRRINTKMRIKDIDCN